MHNINTVDVPVNIGIIKCGSEIILCDSGWKQTEYHKMTHFEHFTPLPEQLKLLGLIPPTSRRSSSATPTGITRGSCSIFRTPRCMCNARSCAASNGR